MRFESSWSTNRYDEGVVNASNPLDYMIREAVHLRPGTLIVRDLHRRRHAADTLTASFHLGLTNAVQKAAFGYQVAGLRISVLYPAEVDVSFRPDTDASTNIIGSVMHLDFASSTTPMELITVFSESLTINSYANRVLKLSDGTKLTFGINGPLSVVLPGTDLAIQRSGGSVILNWSNANSVLQSSRVVDGPFQDVFGAKSPYSYSILSNAQFFRLSQNEPKNRQIAMIRQRPPSG